LTEAVIEWILFPQLKRHYLIASFGLGMAIVGQSIRSMAMIQASSNFSHHIMHEKEASHQLVKTGVYSISRHPSYFGFFYWALGLQIFLCNPLSSIGFITVLWRFFDGRIRHEEKLLVEFFGSEYLAYRVDTPTRIPFIP
jgi:protein-S-isoprenylcysteine O-methyltransferase